MTAARVFAAQQTAPATLVSIAQYALNPLVF